MEDAELYTVAGLGVGIIFGAIWGIFYVFRIIAEWRIFAKAGERGWKTLIPFLNTYTEYKLTADTKSFAIYMIATFVAALLQEFTKEDASTTMQVITLIVNVVVVVVTVKRWSYLAKSFGKGTGFTIGLLFLHPFFIMALGYGNARYIGPSKE